MLLACMAFACVELLVPTIDRMLSRATYGLLAGCNRNLLGLWHGRNAAVPHPDLLGACRFDWQTPGIREPLRRGSADCSKSDKSGGESASLPVRRCRLRGTGSRAWAGDHLRLRVDWQAASAIRLRPLFRRGLSFVSGATGSMFKAQMRERALDNLA